MVSLVLKIFVFSELTFYFLWFSLDFSSYLIFEQSTHDNVDDWVWNRRNPHQILNNLWMMTVTVKFYHCYKLQVATSICWQILFFSFHWYNIGPNIIRRVLFFGPEKCLKEFKSRVGVAPKKRFWSTVFSLRKWTKINFLDQNQLFRTKIAFWHVIIIFEGKIQWTKIAF